MRRPRLTVPLVAGALAVATFALLRPGPFRATISSPQALLRIALIGIAFRLASWVLGRFVRRPALRAGLLLIPAAVLAWLVVAPYFRSQRVVEALPTSMADVAGPAAPAPAAAASAPVTAPPATTATTAATATTTTAPAASPTSSTPATTSMPAATSTTPAPAPTGPVKLTSGRLRGIDHRASGEAAIYRLAEGGLIVRLEDIDIQNGPDYVLYLVPGADRQRPEGGIDLGRLKGNQGSQNYAVPPGVDPAQPYTVLIWCRAFSVPVANATQRPA
jgi:hypothetical protein